jgi:hypothetical protein
MTSRWAGIDAKLGRAQHHYDELAAMYTARFEPGPTQFDIELDGSPSKCLIRVSNLPTIDESWRLVLGDVLTNLRASLDHLAWQLVLAFAPDPPTRDTKFPIHKSRFSEKGNERQPLNLTPAVSNQDVLDRLVRNQPYQHRWLPPGSQDQDGEWSALWQLNELCNLDKHRQLVLVTTRFDIGNMYFGTDLGVEIGELTANVRPLNEGDRVATIPFKNQPIPKDFRPHTKLAAHIWEPGVKWATMRNVREQTGWYYSTVHSTVMDQFRQGLL